MHLYATGSGRRDLAGLSLDDVLGNESKSLPPLYSRTPSQIRRTLWEIIREQERDEQKDRKAWRRFKDRLRLQHTGVTWSRSIEVPVSDILLKNSTSLSSRMQNKNHQKGSRSDKFSKDRHVMAEENYCGGDDDQVCDLNSRSCSRPGMMRRASPGYDVPVQVPSKFDNPMPGSTQEKTALQPQMMRHNSTKMGSVRRDSTRSLARSEWSLLSGDDPDFIGYGGKTERSLRRILPTSTDDCQMSAREAAAAQEASEAEAAISREDEKNGGLFVQDMTENEQLLRMSLMDLLEETDRQMGYTCSSYMIGEEDDDEGDENNEEEDKQQEEEAGERSCSVCMVKHKEAPSGACRHSFCKLCSRELRVGNGNCPSCNDFNLEIIEVF